MAYGQKLRVSRGANPWVGAARSAPDRDLIQTRVADLRPGFGTRLPLIIQRDRAITSGSIMLMDALIDSLPDLVVLVRRDGIILSHGGGHGLSALKLDGESVGKRLDMVWPEAAAELVMRLSRRAIALRGSTEARFQDGGRHYEARLIAQGPDRALCVIRQEV